MLHTLEAKGLRHNIYLPDDLSRSVQQAGISISTVCQTALRDEVRKVNAHRQVTTDLESVVDRLRRTRSEDDARLEELGRREGVRWARESATWRDLEELLDDDGPGRENGVWEWIHEAAQDRGLDTAADTELGGPFLDAFIAGARDVYDEVSPLM
jgi:post-segregation antitoxin (ccd killing protein)